MTKSIRQTFLLISMISFLHAFSSSLCRAEMIKDIRIVDQHEESYDISSVMAYTSFSIGDKVGTKEEILAAIAIDVNRMRESGRFSYVDAHMNVEEDGVVLIYKVISKHRLRSLTIQGAKKLSNRKIRKKSKLDIGQFVDDATFAQAASRIKDTYKDYWYPDATITWESHADDDLGVVDVTFSVTEGKKLVIKNILFEGNAHCESDQLRKVMQQKKKHWFPLWSRLTGSGKYLPEMEDQDLFAIKSLYMNDGFLDVDVSSPTLLKKQNKNATLSIQITEGRQYFINNITLSGIERFEQEQVEQQLMIHSGDIAAYSQIQHACEMIRSFYGNRGYIRTSVNPVLDPNALTGKLDIQINVKEGEVGYIDKIIIRGNENTRDKVIRRELIIHPGDKYHRSRIQTSENRLRNLNYFESVSSSPTPTPLNDRYNLNVTVKEKPTGQFSAGVGFSSIDSLVGYVELAQGNFDLKRWPPAGGGQKFKIRAQLGTQRNDIDISFTEPWFLNRKLSFGVDLFHREARYFSDNYDQENNGMRYTFSKPLSRFTRGSLAYALEQFDVFDVATTASQAIKEEEGTRLKSSLSFILTRDTRDRYFNPTKGSKTTITPYFAGGPLGAQTDIFGGRIRSTHYWPLGDTVFNIRGHLETVDSFGNNSGVGSYGGVPIFDRLFMGGSYTLRGFEYRDVGPIEGDDRVGGRSMGFVTGEITKPLWQQISGAIFYDAGFVNAESFDFNTSGYNSDWGIGLRFDLPGFPLHLDYAFPIKSDEKNESNGRFNFLIGHTF